MNPNFLNDISKIDAIIQQEPVNERLVEKTLPLLCFSENESYFYSQLNTGAWISPLESARQFSNGAITHSADGKVSWKKPSLDALSYLGRFVQSKPEEVARILSNLEPQDNWATCRIVVSAASKMPLDTLRNFAGQLTEWLRISSRYNEYEMLAGIVERLWEAEAVAEATQLLAAALEPRRILAGEERASKEIYCLLDNWAIDGLLEAVLPLLKSRQQLVAIDALTGILCASRQAEDVTGAIDISSWRAELPSIEDHEQNQLYERYPNSLIFVIRDIALAIALENANWPDMISCLRKYDDKLVMRTELYLRSKFPEIDPHGTSELLSREEILGGSEYHHERFHLLKACFGKLTEEAQRNYFRFVEDETRLVAIRKKLSDVSEGDWPRLKRRLIYDRLIPIAEYLEDDWNSRYEEYLAEFGEEPHPDFHFYMEGGRLINRVTTRPLEEFTDCSAKDFAARIRDLESVSGSSDASKSELANTLQDLVASRTTEFANAAEDFKGFPLMYGRSFLGGIRDYLETRRPLEATAWHSILLLCDSEVERYVNKIEPKDAYRETYMHLRTIISILQSGFKHDEVQLPIAERDLAWSVLHPLTDHPDPQREEEGPDEDMATSSINTVRGEAMHAVVDYAWWVRHNSGEDFKGMVTVPEVQEVLDRRLTDDKALTICAVYGKWYPWLETIDPKWAQNWKDRIFPESDEARRCVAWETYITFCPPYNGIFESLKGDYAWAITKIGNWPDRQRSMGHPDESLLEHLFAYYWRGKLNLDDPDVPLRDAYAKANVDHKVEALRYVGRGLKEWVSVDSDTLERLKTLWEKVLEKDEKDKKKTLETFGLWFSSPNLDAVWSLAALQRMLDEAKPLRPDHWIIEKLGQLANEFPGETLRCLDSLYKYAESPLYLEHWWEHVMAVLRAALSSENLELKTKAIKLANIIGSKGLQPQNLSELRALVENA